jgi:hypothetical protein
MIGNYSLCSYDEYGSDLHPVSNVLGKNGNKAKPHGLLVLVSSMHYCTSTPSLSTL